MMIDENEWEKFRGVPSAPFDERIYVTLNHKSQIYLNRHTYKLLGSPSHVELYMRRTGESILIAPTTTRTASSFAVSPKQVGYIILANPFCRHHHIQTSTTIQFTGIEITNQILKLDLTQTINTEIAFRRPRTSKKL
ncbi:MAG: hypothetical protein ABL999_03125 [Pyrinomonadaceae bacterium]